MGGRLFCYTPLNARWYCENSSFLFLHPSWLLYLLVIETETVKTLTLIENTIKVAKGDMCVQSLTCIQLCWTWASAHQASCPSLSPRVCSNPCPLSQWCYLSIPSSSPPAFNLSQHQSLFNKSALCIRWPKYWSFSFSITPSNEYSGFISFRIEWFDLLAFQGILKSSPTPQFKRINSLVLSLLFGLTLTSIHDYWKNHSFDYMDFCRQSDVFAF